jgi:hypothetical protein
MNLSDNLETIQRYLTHQMSSEERFAFETEMKSSPELAAEVRSLREWRIVAKNQDLFDTKTMLDRIQQENPMEPDFSDADLKLENETPPPKNHILRWTLGSILIGFLILGIWKFQQSTTQNHYKTLAIQLLQDYPVENIVGFDTLSKNPDTLQLVNAMRFYDQKAYFQAIPLLKNYKHFAKDDIVKFYWAISLIQTGQAADAVPILEKLSTDAEGIIQLEARQNYPIALIANGEEEKAKILLAKMAMDKEGGTKAKDILTKLNP